MKIAIFTKQRLDEDPETISDQEQKCRAWAEEKGHEVVAVLRTGYFAAHDQGPFRQLRDAINSGRYEGIVASDHARYARQPDQVEALQEAASVARVRLFTVEPDEELIDPLIELMKTPQVDKAHVAIAVIVQDGRVLMVRPTQWDAGRPWQFPGGQIESGETPEQAAVREVNEEIGLSVVPIRRLGERDHPTTRRHLVYIACEVSSGIAHVAAPREIEEVAWSTLPQVAARSRGYGLFGPIQAFLDRELGGA